MKKWPVPTISLFGSFVIRIIGRIIYIDKQKQVIMRLRGLLKINSPGILFYTFSIFQKLKDTEWYLSSLGMLSAVVTASFHFQRGSLIKKTKSSDNRSWTRVDKKTTSM